MTRLFPLLAGLAAVTAATSAPAQERALYESVPGWQVEWSKGVAGDRQCVIVRNYVDEDDEDADNTVSFAIENKALLVVLKYSKWAYDTEAKYPAATLFGGKVANPKATWTASGDQLVGRLPANLADKAAGSEEIALKGKDWNSAFNLFGAADAFAALKRCNAGEKPNSRS